MGQCAAKAKSWGDGDAVRHPLWRRAQFILASPHARGVVWDLLIIVSEPPFPHLQNEESNMMPTSRAVVRLPRDDAGKALKTESGSTVTGESLRSRTPGNLSIPSCSLPRTQLSPEPQPRHLPTPPPSHPSKEALRDHPVIPLSFPKGSGRPTEEAIKTSTLTGGGTGGDGVGVVRPCPWCLGSERLNSGGGVTLGDRKPGKTHALKSDRSGSNLAQPQSSWMNLGSDLEALGFSFLTWKRLPGLL